MNYKKIVLVLVGLVTLSAGNILTNIHLAAAAPSGPTEDQIRSAQISWVDRDHLQAVIGQQTYTFTDGDPGDTTYDYSIEGYSCYGKIHVPDMSNAGQIKFDMDAVPTSGATTKCGNVDGANGNDFTANNAGNAAMMFYRKDQSTVTRSDGNSSWTFTKSNFINSAGQTVFLRSSENNKTCQDRVLVSADGQNAELWVLDPKDTGAGTLSKKHGYMGKLNGDQRTSLGLASESSTCYYFGAASGSGIDSGVTMPLGSPGNATGPATPVPGSTTGSSSGGTDADNTVDCGGEGFNWAICPIIKMGIKASDTLDTFIMSTLNVDVGPIFDQTTTKDSASQGYYTAWNSFRVLATAIIIIAGIIMVVSQALGFEMLDAYTVRKTLPRLLVAVIGISLSWPLMRLAVSFFDTLGFDLRNLMYAPFKSFGTTISATTGILSTIGVTAAIFIIGPASLTFIITALLAVFVGFLILVIRQVALIMLIILAPVALACYVLPNTQKVWKLWIDNFLGLLLMFPIISALIAAGHIFAAVSLKSNTGNSPHAVVAQAIGIVAYFVPYFLLPLAARLATGVIGNLAGVVNDRGKGVFDRLKKVRGNSALKNIHDMKSGSRFSDRNKFTRAVNRSTAGVGAGWNGRFGLPTERGNAAISQARHSAAMNDVMKSPRWVTIQDNDDALRAATYNSAGAARTALLARGWDATRVDQSVAAAQAAVGFGRPQAIAAAQQMATTGTGYQSYVDSNGVKHTAMEDQARTIARASGGDKNNASAISGYNNYINKQKGRFDLAPGATDLMALAHSEIDGNKSPATMKSAYQRATIKGAQSADAVTLLRGKKYQVENLTDALREQFENDTGNQVLRGQVQDLYDSLSYASPENQKVVRDNLDQFGISSRRVGNDPNDPGNQGS